MYLLALAEIRSYLEKERKEDLDSTMGRIFFVFAQDFEETKWKNFAQKRK